MYLILLLFILVFVCSFFYLKTPNEGFETNMHDILPVSITGTKEDPTVHVPNNIMGNKDEIPVVFGGNLITRGNLNVQGSLLDVSGEAMFHKSMTVTDTIHAGNVFKNQHSAIPPVGSIMAYAGKTDPDGWVICNGVPRTQTDGRYNALIDLQIGSGTKNITYTPPDLKNQFLKGTSTETTLVSYVKPLVTLSIANLPSHNHGGTIANANPKHVHTINDPGHTHTWGYGSAGDDSGYGSHAREFTFDGGENTDAIKKGYTGIAVNEADMTHTHTFTSDNVGTNTPVEIPDPSNYTVHYILKY